MKIFIGPAGVPISCPKKDTLSGVKFVAELGLNLMEVQFVRGVKLKEEKAKEIGEVAKELGVRLSVHAPYYVNLASIKEETIKRSMEDWLYNSVKIAHIMGASCVVFHPASYSGRDKMVVHEIVRENLKKFLKKVEDFDVYICPETTGKKGQYGDLDEIIKLVKEIKHPKLRFCIDFAHLHARHGGLFKHKPFDYVFEKILNELGEEYLNFLHIHFSSIEYGEKGERAHLPIDHKEPDFELLAKTIKKYSNYIDELEIVSESPLLEKDALKMKEILEKELGIKI